MEQYEGWGLSPEQREVSCTGGGGEDEGGGYLSAGASQVGPGE